MMKKLLFLLPFIILLTFCEHRIVDPGNQSIYELDSTIYMYCEVNSEIFYAKEISNVHGEYSPNSPHNYIVAIYPYEQIRLEINLQMGADQLHSNFLPSLYFGKSSYKLSTNEPYDLNTPILSDSLIQGNFYGVFINIHDSLDTINITDGYFEIHPYIENDLFLSAVLNGNYYSTTEGFYRMRGSVYGVYATDSTFQDTLEAEILINVLSFSDNFEKEYYFDPNKNFLLFAFETRSKITGKRNQYSGISGTLTINEIEHYEYYDIRNRLRYEDRISSLSFDVNVQNEKGEILNLKDGNFSVYGY